MYNKRNKRIMKVKTYKSVFLKMNILALSLTSLLCLDIQGCKTVDVSETFQSRSNSVYIQSSNIKTKEIKSNMLIPNILVGSNIIKSAEEYAVDANEVKQMVENQYTGQEKTVFLTFDDGPSPNTKYILDILKEKGVHATFFIKGDMLNNTSAQEYLKRTINEGHAIGNHSYTHSLRQLYPNNKLDIDTFMKEFDKTNNILKEILGSEFNCKILRMPGGYMSRKYYNDPNLPSFNNILNERGIISIDWNSMNGDSEGKDYSVQQLIDNVKNGTEGYKQSILLMHDTYGKESTVESLPYIIDNFKENGFSFKVIKSTIF